MDRVNALLSLKYVMRISSPLNDDIYHKVQRIESGSSERSTIMFIMGYFD